MSFGAKVDVDGATYDCYGFCKKCNKMVDFKKGKCILCHTQKGLFT
jgi:hypothetical protein